MSIYTLDFLMPPIPTNPFLWPFFLIAYAGMIYIFWDDIPSFTKAKNEPTIKKAITVAIIMTFIYLLIGVMFSFVAGN